MNECNLKEEIGIQVGAFPHSPKNEPCTAWARGEQGVMMSLKIKNIKKYVYLVCAYIVKI